MHRVYSLGTNATPTARDLSVFDVKIFFYHIHLPHKRRLRLAHKTMVVPMRSHAFEHVTAQLSTWASINDPREHPYSVRCAKLAPIAHAQRFLSSNEHIDYTATTEACMCSLQNLHTRRGQSSIMHRHVVLYVWVPPVQRYRSSRRETQWHSGLTQPLRKQHVTQAVMHTCAEL